MMPKSILFLFTLCLAGVAFGQSWNDPYAALPTPKATELPPLHTSRQLKVDASSDLTTLLPLSLPGYELRVMDITKKVSFDVGGEPVLAEVPIFIYVPRSPKSMEEATRELRKLYNDLIMLYDQDRVDKERVRGMLKRMDGIIDTFDAISPSVTRHTAPAE